MSTPQQQLIDYIRDVSRPFRSSLAGMGRSEQEFMPHFERIVQLALSDLCALVQKDPAARGRPAYVWHAYGSIKAVVDYRVAHEIFAFAPDAECAELFQSLARELSEDSKQRSGIEIHPAARIGPGFIVDHGLGTVIGETAELGSDCVVLQGVVLGALGTSVMTDGRRHPRLGDRVQVCSFAKVLGPVTVGDGSFIGPECLVLRDMPASAQIKRVHCWQLTRDRAIGSASRAVVYGVVPAAGMAGQCTIHGRHFDGLVPRIVDRDDPAVDLVAFVHAGNGTEIRIVQASPLGPQRQRPVLVLGGVDTSELTVHDSPGLEAFYGALFHA